MSWQIAGHYSSSGIIIIPTDTSLLVGETDGLAVDFTDTTQYYPSWDVAADQWYSRVQVRTSSVDVYSDPQTFFSNAGTSPKYVRASSTTIGWSPHNMALQSQAFDNAAWVKGVGSTITANTSTAPDGSSTADTSTAAATTGQHACASASSISVMGSAVYTASAYIKYSNLQYAYVTYGSFTSSTQWVRVTADIQGGTITQSDNGVSGTLLSSSITSVGGGWYRLSVTGSILDTGAFIEVSGINTGTPASASFGETAWTGTGTEAILFWGAQLNRGIAATEYIATTAAAAIGLPISYGEGLWVEPAATNKCLQSEDFSTTWTKNNTITTNSTQAPDGTSTADTQALSAGSIVHNVFQSISGGFSSALTGSVYLKMGTYRYIGIVLWGSGTTNYAVAIADLQTGTITQTTSGAGAGASTSSITSVGNGWYRVTISCNVGSGTDNGGLSVEAYSSGTPTLSNFGDEVWNSAGTETFYSWGAQVESGSVATSYIPTAASSVTRAKDNIIVASSAFPDASATGTAYAKMLTNASGTTMAFYCYQTTGFTDGDLVYSTSSVKAEFFDNAAHDITIDTTLSMSNGVAFQVTQAWSANDSAVSANGAATLTNSGTRAVNTVQQLQLGEENQGTQFNGFMQKFVIVPRRVSNGSLPTWRYS